MLEVTKYKCSICGKEFIGKGVTIYNARSGVTKQFKEHLKTEHSDVTFEQYVKNTYFNGIHPLCSCGCGKKLNFTPKNALWDPQNAFGKFYNAGHTPKNNSAFRNSLKQYHINKYNNKEWITKYYYNTYGKEILEKSAVEFLEENELTNIDIAKKYNIDIRTLKNAWFSLGLVTKEQWKECSNRRKYKVASKHRRKFFFEEEEICQILYSIITQHPLKYNIRSLIKYYNDNNLVQIEADVPVVLEKLEKYFGESIYEYLEFGNHSKEEKEFLKILKFLLVVNMNLEKHYSMEKVKGIHIFTIFA